jgi:hypothetical protein
MEQYDMLLALLLMSLVFVSIVPVIETGYAHRDGCHRWHSCPSDSGGGYVCGDLGKNDGC